MTEENVIENFDSTNEDLEANYDDDVSNTQEQEIDADATEEQADEADDSRSRAQSQIDRLKAELKAEKAKSSKEGKENGTQSNQKGSKEASKVASSDTERIDRIELKSEGVKDKDSQDFVLEYAQVKGMDLSEALQSRVVQAELKEIAEKSKQKSASATPSNRTGSRRTDDVGYWASQLTNKGKSAPTAEMRRKVRQHLAGK